MSARTPPFAKQAATPSDTPEARARQVNAIQSEAQRRETQNATPFAGMVEINTEDEKTEGIAFSAGGDKTLTHNLGRVPRVVMVLKALVGSPGAPTVVSADEKTVKLNFPAACTAVIGVA